MVRFHRHPPHILVHKGEIDMNENWIHSRVSRSLATATCLTAKGLWKILDSAEYGEHISLTCVNHRHLRWNTKNIAPIGCRMLFFFSAMDDVECDCPLRDLVPVYSCCACGWVTHAAGKCAGCETLKGE